MSVQPAEEIYVSLTASISFLLKIKDGAAVNKVYKDKEMHQPQKKKIALHNIEATGMDILPLHCPSLLLIAFMSIACKAQIK